MKADPEQRAVQLGEYIAAHNATVRAAAAAFGCSKSTVHKDVAVRLRCTGRCVPCWRATRPSVTCGAGLPPGADTAAAKPQKDRCIVQRSFLSHFFMEGAAKSGCFYPPVWNCCNAPFSSRLTCA